MKLMNESRRRNFRVAQTEQGSMNQPSAVEALVYLSFAAMGSFFFFILYITSLYANTNRTEVNCPAVKCSHGTPEPDIHFPFRLKDQVLQHCGLPGFELFCTENTTMIHFPSFGDLVVKSISYDTKKIELLDPKSCVHEVFLNLNLSPPSLFNYYFIARNYTYLNCSARLPPAFKEVPCLSGSTHFVYTVKPSLAVPLSCRAVKTIAIPFAYSPYLSDNSFGLGLTWELPGCEGCEGKGGLKKFLSKATFINYIKYLQGLYLEV
ncbi:RING-H2 finger protein ATL22-like [Mangifera indica]|uniref:RING-H2 finger protein ATL22-like n=1 Tax=Mangifera indica TaxID=29780 RepID=UPI001CF9B8C2|nr:RING-H2 finger protein ATL22-like [Mangifera indica]